ncbi:MAG: tRNA preQ1(34) S-adenosylmethionine ribosyltransferase-isomerase QueA, partial [Rickettsiaceae bacterium]|nr:tRNA preQ1(34) S-adenosylmethionine ribosyltransferase-isomerase QueA [Rickettsiaceae bacterium]
VEPNGNLTDSRFYKLHEYIDSDSLIIFNDSQVIKAFITLYKNDKEIGINLNKPLTERIWSGFAKPARKLEIGDAFEFGDHKIIIKQKNEDGSIDLEFDLAGQISVYDFLEIYGATPLPPYIRDGKADFSDQDSYQTIYSKIPGSVAAPTAGIHFSDNVFVNLQKKGVDFSFVTLHVGAGTYLPIKDSIESHKMHSEFGEISDESADKIKEAKKLGKKIIAVGTSTLRILESSAMEGGFIKPGKCETDIFIKPGFEFKVVDRLITNFHLPRSTLMLLVSAFAGYDNIRKAYNHSIKNRYRFLSYGDSMLLTKKDSL